MPGTHTGTLNIAVAPTARTSNGAGSLGPQSDESFIRYLMRHKHTSPFEMVEFKEKCAKMGMNWIFNFFNQKTRKYL
jgi:hypothetical protein